jgi:hypothetical protein
MKVRSSEVLTCLLWEPTVILLWQEYTVSNIQAHIWKGNFTAIVGVVLFEVQIIRSYLLSE